ncbi:MAG: (2Fe-2S)-binding protein [Deltaproteobacteria bacterium]|nr:(2Fe-2S)-binding protein [Deltaproteobacteria bacterium]
MSTVTVNIDGNKIIAEEGLTILEVAKRSDITIPTLCYIKDTVSKNPCEICVVEISNFASCGLKSSLVTEGLFRACVTLAREGMEILTDSEAVIAHRQQRLAVLSETHYGDCKAPCNLTCPGQINVH